MSSDGGGCLPTFNGDGELLKMDVGRSETLLNTLRQARELGLPLEQLFPLVTENPARLFRLHGRGSLEVGSYADVVILNRDLSVQGCLAEGRWMVRDGIATVKGLFERSES